MNSFYLGDLRQKEAIGAALAATFRFLKNGLGQFPKEAIGAALAATFRLFHSIHQLGILVLRLHLAINLHDLLIPSLQSRGQLTSALLTLLTGLLLTTFLLLVLTSHFTFGHFSTYTREYSLFRTFQVNHLLNPTSLSPM